MKTQFVTSLVMVEDGFEAGKEVAQLAVDKIQLPRSPQLVILFCSDKYEYAAVLRGVKQVVGRAFQSLAVHLPVNFRMKGSIRGGFRVR